MNFYKITYSDGSTITVHEYNIIQAVMGRESKKMEIIKVEKK